LKNKFIDLFESNALLYIFRNICPFSLLVHQVQSDALHINLSSNSITPVYIRSLDVEKSSLC